MNAAAISGVDLAAAYEHCRRYHRWHGRTFYVATNLLPAAIRRHVWALYSFARYADDIVDEPQWAGRRDESLASLKQRFTADVTTGSSSHPLLAATIDTMLRYDLGIEPFERFFAAMERDLYPLPFADWSEVLQYMDGSAAVIGEMMLPVLRPSDPGAAAEPARQLGRAFQLTNFLRDIGEDLGRGRVYLPSDELAQFGVDLGRREVTPEFVALMQFQIGRARDLYQAAEPGIRMLHGRSAACVALAARMYAALLADIERHDYDVFTRRATVAPLRRAKLYVLPAWTG
ncbi:MAG TPA: phytoene/squalene synthase family protein [Ilumatobacter sp.]|nr:phytoene/squalene synthase family protein [Ilumatobacter sp.]